MDRRAVRRPPRWAAAWPKGGCSGRPLQGANNGARWREAGGTRRWFCGRPRPAVPGLAAPHFTPRRPRTRLCGAGNTPQPPSPHLLPRRAVAAPSLPRLARGAQLERDPGPGATRGAKARGPRLGRAGSSGGPPCAGLELLLQTSEGLQPDGGSVSSGYPTRGDGSGAARPRAGRTDTSGVAGTEGTRGTARLGLGVSGRNERRRWQL